MNSESSKPRSGIYARSATDKNGEAIARQIRRCQTAAEERKLNVVTTHSDEAVSGMTSIASRNGGKQLLNDAENRAFDVLLVDDIERLSRNSTELFSIINHLTDRGIQVIGISDGYDSIAILKTLHQLVYTPFSKISG